MAKLCLFSWGDKRERGEWWGRGKREDILKCVCVIGVWMESDCDWRNERPVLATRHFLDISICGLANVLAGRAQRPGWSTQFVVLVRFRVGAPPRGMNQPCPQSCMHLCRGHSPGKRTPRKIYWIGLKRRRPARMVRQRRRRRRRSRTLLNISLGNIWFPLGKRFLIVGGAKRVGATLIPNTRRFLQADIFSQKKKGMKGMKHAWGVELCL